MTSKGKKLTTVQVLTKARNLVRKGWCQGPCAKTKGGRKCDPLSDRAVSFCAFGALWRVMGHCPFGEPDDLMHEAAKKAGSCGYITLNDDNRRKKPEVVALFNAAIRAAKKRSRK